MHAIARPSINNILKIGKQSEAHGRTVINYTYIGYYTIDFQKLLIVFNQKKNTVFLLFLLIFGLSFDISIAFLENINLDWAVFVNFKIGRIRFVCFWIGIVVNLLFLDRLG